MNRRRSIAAFAAVPAAFLLPSASRGQAPAQVPRVAILMFGSPANFRTRSEAFIRGMHDLGYDDGRNVRFEWHSADGQADLLRSTAEALSRTPPAVIVSASTTTTRALHAVTKTVPIVMASTEDPVAEGFVQSLAQPSTNLTAISASVLDQIPRQMELLAEVAPKATSITALLNPANATYRGYRERLEAAARPGVRLRFADARTPGEIDRALASTGHERNAALIVMNDPVLYTARRGITEHVARPQLPAVYPLRGFVEAGGLISYGPNPEANFVRAATYVDRILRGARPAELAVEPPARFELAINREAARGLGITLRAQLLRQATAIVD